MVYLKMVCMNNHEPYYVMVQCSIILISAGIGRMVYLRCIQFSANNWLLLHQSKTRVLSSLPWESHGSSNENTQTCAISNGGTN